MKTNRPALLLLLSAMLPLAPVAAQPPVPPAIHHTFEEGAAGWTALGETAKVSTAKGAGDAKEGKAALRFDYNVQAGQLSALLLSLANHELATTPAIGFWVKTDYDTTLVVMLQEQNGGRYVALVAAAGGVWQGVELADTDFALSTEGDAPPDPNRQLDFDAVETVGLGDINMLMANGPAPLVELFGVKKGPHYFLVDDFWCSREPLKGGDKTRPGVSLDAFLRPQVGWIKVGQVKLDIAIDDPIPGRAMRAVYRQAPGKIIGLSRWLSPRLLVGTRQLSFEIANTHPALLLFQLEEKSGAKYSRSKLVAGGNRPEKITLEFEKFKLDKDSTDDNGKLDLDQVKQITILDLSGSVSQEDELNALCLGDLRALP